MLLDGLLDAAGQADLTVDTLPSSRGRIAPLDRALQQTYQQGSSVVVLFDEFAELLANQHLTPHFSGACAVSRPVWISLHLNGQPEALFAITAEETVLSSPFFNIFVNMPLGLFTEAEAHELFRQRLERTGQILPPELIAYLVELCRAAFLPPHRRLSRHSGHQFRRN